MNSEPNFLLALLCALIFALLICLPFLIWSRRKLLAIIALLILWFGQFFLFQNERVLIIYTTIGETEAGILLALLVMLPLPLAMMRWRRTRRLGLVLLGLEFGSWLVLYSYWSEVTWSIGYLLLLIALWPCWRLLKGGPGERELPPVIPSRGVLQSRPWPACRKGGFTLASALAGVVLLTAAFWIATATISGTIAAIRRADHLAAATELLEGARERSLLGVGMGDLPASAARLLPHGRASIACTAAEAGLTRVSLVVAWEERTGKPGKLALEWLTAERTP